MRRPHAAWVRKLDAIYEGQTYFVSIKARLLAAFDLFLVFVFVPFNVAKLVWVNAPGLELRVLLNVCLAAAGLGSLACIRRGKLTWAGNMVILGSILPVHALAFSVQIFNEPLAVAVQLFAFDLGFLLLALVFATRRVAAGVLLIVVAGHLGFHHFVMANGPHVGTLPFAAETLRRDGLITFGFVFCLASILVSMIEATQRRSEEALRQTQASRDHLERLVAERTHDLADASARANEASKAKGDFLANMSHEIRTPLNGIIASADLLRRRADLPLDAAAQARLISDSGELLLKLLGDILDFSKIEAGQVAIEKHPFALTSLVEDSLALVAASAERSGVTLELAPTTGLPACVEGDSFRLRQVLLNLLSNAIKFTPKGGRVRLSVESDAAAAEDGLRVIRFVVRDTGIGMDELALKRLFQRFTQADSSTTRRYGGTGLGLAISSRLVGMLGGTITVESTPGVGSIFRCEVPMRVVQAPVHSPAASGERIQPLGISVLVAEDNPVNRKVLAAQLAQLGCSYTMVADGAEFLQALIRGMEPDVVLMDCHMPVLDGWEATRRLRGWASDARVPVSRRKTATVPVIALTAAALPEERARCLESGMTGFIAKPVRLAELQDELKRVTHTDATPAPENEKPPGTAGREDLPAPGG